MTGPRVAHQVPTATDLTRRCPATLRFPAEPYHNLRCSLHPHDPTDLHVVTTTVPTEYISPTQAAWRKPEMATVRLTWATEPTKN